MSFGERLEYYRELTKLNKKEFAQFLGMTQKNFSEITRDKHNPRLKTVKKVVLSSGIPADLFFSDYDKIFKVFAIMEILDIADINTLVLLRDLLNTTLEQKGENAE